MILSNQRRREVIVLLRANDSGLTVRDLSERIAANESGQDPAPRKVKQSVYVSLLQTHLPKLDKLGVIDYDSQRKSARINGGLGNLTNFLENGANDGWSLTRYYTGLSLLGILTIFGAAMDTPLISSVSTEAWGVGFLALLFVSGLYQIIRKRRAIFHRLHPDSW